MLCVRVYSVFDSKGDVYGEPWFAMNDAVARRMFVDGVNDSRTAMYKHAEDYTLFYVGEWDASGGKLAGVEPVAIVNGIKVKESV